MKDARTVLRERARRLAAETGARGAPQEVLQVVEFRLGSERYAVEESSVTAVAPLRQLVPLPGVPGFVLGLAHVRGALVAVLDLRILFDLPRPALGDGGKLVLVSPGGRELALVADEVPGARALPVAELGPPPASFADLRRDALRGITADGLALLDARTLLGDARLVVDDEGG
ncbi:MAG: purine-binding chemotaxis protein CheW [Deltaproteobacteria bacterium]|nr:purine-binding chemotaxis protein CheW [Deltaproteobacteria bacterium]